MAMNRKKLLIEWSPTPKQINNNNYNNTFGSPSSPNYIFVIGSVNLKFYLLNHKVDFQKGKYAGDGFVVHYTDCLDRCQNKIASIGVNTDIQNIRCLSWAPSGNPSEFLAVGLTNGRMVLTSYANPKGAIKEFVPLHCRACNAVAWNPVYQNLIASGLEKVRNSSSALVWDINTPGVPIVSDDIVLSGIEDTSLNVSTVQVNQPKHELDNSEATLALAWLPSIPTCLVTGTSSRWLLLYDIRVSNSPSQSVTAHPKSVNGVVVNPFQDIQLATYSDDAVIKIWDTRRLLDPLLTINTNSKGLSQISWCPTRTGILASASKSEPSIRLWDIKPAMDLISPHVTSPSQQQQQQQPQPHFSDRIMKELIKAQEEIESTSSEHICGTEPISSFSWHPTDEFLMLTINNEGRVKLQALREVTPISFSPDGHFAAAGAKNLFEGNPDQHMLSRSCPDIDISFVMQERARAGYSSNAEKNHKVVVKKFEVPTLASLWRWIYKMKYKYQKGVAIEYKGITSLISKQKEKTHKSQQMKVVMYKSTERSVCSTLCDWGFKNAEQFEKKISDLEEQGQFSRAAALSVFHFNANRALRTLSNQINRNTRDTENMSTRLIAMALSGFLDRSSMWTNTCAAHACQMSDPYLQSMFRFLCVDPENPNYDSVLHPDSKMSLFDKVAFALRFLKHEELVSFLCLVQERVIATGDLQGLLVTGIDDTGKGIELLQNYLNNTGDIQTVACLVSQVSRRKVNFVEVDKWLYSYHNLLNQWQMWYERAKFDVDRVPNNEVPTQPHVYAACGFCSTPFTLGRDSARRRPMGVEGDRAVSLPDVKRKVIQCPACSKPLPRCSVCLLSFECTPFDPRNIQAGVDCHFWKSSHCSFENWFSWCQTCKHGGHVGHLKEWFQSHKECAVADCHCCCDSFG